MELSLKNNVLLVSILLTGLSAGFFYAWEVSVIPGTKRISDYGYLEAMQAINRAVLNPAFFLIFFVSLLSLGTSSYLSYRSAVDTAFGLMLAATLVYFLGTMGITALGNVPLNEALDGINIQELSQEALRETRSSYETLWNRYNTLRTIFAVLAFILSIMAGLWKTHAPSLS